MSQTTPQGDDATSSPQDTDAAREPEDAVAAAPPPPTGARPASGARLAPQALTVILLVVIAIQLAVIAGLVATRHPAASASATAPASGQATDTSTDTSAASGTESTSAPSQTDATTLALLHAEVTRDPDDARAQGGVDAPVVLVLYSDFGCPYCTLFAQDVEPELDLVANGTLRIEWRDLAQITETSPLAAQAGIAAANQGRFWQFHDAVYAAADPSSHPTYTQDSLLALAQQAGVPDLDQFRTDMTAQATVDAVTQAKTHAYSIGISGTPFIIINDAVISGYRDADYVRATILEQAALVDGTAQG